MRGLEQRRIQRRIRAKVDRVQALVDWSPEGQHRSSFPHLGGGLSCCRTQRPYQIVTYIPWGGTGTLFYRWPIVPWLLFLCSCISSLPLRSLITEARLRSQNGLGQKWLLLCQKSHAWFSFSGDSLPYLLILPPFIAAQLSVLSFLSKLKLIIRVTPCTRPQFPGPWWLILLVWQSHNPGQISLRTLNLHLCSQMTSLILNSSPPVGPEWTSLVCLLSHSPG